MYARYHDPALLEDTGGTVDVVTDIRREAALLKTGALQNAIFNSENFSSIATNEKGVIQLFNVGAERMLGYTAAEAMPRDMEKGLQAGFFRYLTKPIKIAEFMQTVDLALEFAGQPAGRAK